MKIESVSVICTKIEPKKNKNNDAYVLIDILDINTGDSFNLMSKDLEVLSKLKPMNKYELDLNLSSSKYGLKLDIENIKEDLGSI